ncbi:MAG: hypothetical protein ACQEP5_06985 [Actinomycetota bacterium]
MGSIQPETGQTVEVLSQNVVGKPDPDNENGNTEEPKELADDGDGRDEGENIQASNEEPEEDSPFGREISEIAQGLEEGETTVEELVAKATSRSVEVLEGVEDKVPEAAKEGIQKAIENSQKGNQQAVEAVGKDQNGENDDEGEEENGGSLENNEGNGVDAEGIVSQNRGRKPDKN